MTRKQMLFMVWLAVKNVNEACNLGHGERMFQHQKAVRRQLGWRFQQESEASMVETLQSTVDQLSPHSEIFPAF